MTGEQLTLDELASELYLEGYVAFMEKQEEEYRASLTAKQLRDYRIFSGEIAARCPKCGKRDVDIEHRSQPDMIGDTYWTEFKCCGYEDEPRNTHLEYDANGRVVDVA